MTDLEKVRVYRRYILGEASEDDVREVFGEEFSEVKSRREFISLVEETATMGPADDLVKGDEDD